MLARTMTVAVVVLLLSACGHNQQDFTADECAQVSYAFNKLYAEYEYEYDAYHNRDREGSRRLYNQEGRRVMDAEALFRQLEDDYDIDLGDLQFCKRKWPIESDRGGCLALESTRSLRTC